MGEETKKYVKVFCEKAKRYGLITIENVNGAQQITNFYEIDDDTANNVETYHGGALPPVSSKLKACAVCGKRVAMCCDKSRQCKAGSGKLPHQCLYCKGLKVCNTAAVGAEIYFLMDESGSMSRADRKEAANAVRRMVQSLQGNGNTYSFVAWASDAGYLFKHETSLSKMSAALASYENNTTGFKGSTNAAKALDLIKPDVLSSTHPVRILLVTDGGFDSEAAAVRVRNELLVNKNVEILAIGVTGAYQSTLTKIGTVPAFSKVVGGSSALTSTFEEIAAILKRNGNNI